MTHLQRRSFLGRTLTFLSGAWMTGAVTRPVQAQAASPTARLKALGITLPAPPAAIGIYVPAVRVGSLLFVSGHGPANLPDGTRLLGKVGRELTLEQGKDSARRVGLNVLTSVQTTLGSLDRVVRVVEVFGKERGTGARSAVGMASLPQNIPVEVEAVFELRD